MIEYPHGSQSLPFPIFLSNVSAWEELHDLEFPSKYSLFLLLADFTTIEQHALVDIGSDLVIKGVRSVCCWGENCLFGEGCFDLAIIKQPGFQTGELDIGTTSHENESFEEALWFALYCASPDSEYWGECSTIVVNLNEAAPSAELENCLSNLEAFNARVVGT